MTPPLRKNNSSNSSDDKDKIFQEKLRQSFAYYADKWDDGNLHNHYKVKLEWLLRIISDQSKYSKSKKLNILDVGCGNGMYLIDIVEALENVNGIGIDMTKEMIASAKKRSLSSLKKNYQWITMDLEHDNYQERLGTQKFDIIMMTGVICYFKSIPSILQSLKSILESEGKLIIIHHNPYYITNLLLKVQSFLEPQFVWTKNPSKDKIITSALEQGYTLQQIRRLPCGGLPNFLYDFQQLFWDGYGFVFSILSSSNNT